MPLWKKTTVEATMSLLWTNNYARLSWLDPDNLMSKEKATRKMFDKTTKMFNKKQVAESY